jgi:hypothetical protein
MVLDLLTLKAKNGWSDTSFNQLLQLLDNLFPKPNNLPTSTYLAKKLLSPLTLGIQKIHACPAYCILYHKEYINEVRCPMCNASRYKTNYDNTDDGSIVMWYLPLIDRLKHLFSSIRDAKLMI